MNSHEPVSPGFPGAGLPFPPLQAATEDTFRAGPCLGPDEDAPALDIRSTPMREAEAPQQATEDTSPAGPCLGPDEEAAPLGLRSTPMRVAEVAPQQAAEDTSRAGPCLGPDDEAPSLGLRSTPMREAIPPDAGHVVVALPEAWQGDGFDFIAIDATVVLTGLDHPDVMAQGGTKPAPGGADAGFDFGGDSVVIGGKGADTVLDLSGDDSSRPDAFHFRHSAGSWTGQQGDDLILRSAGNQPPAIADHDLADLGAPNAFFACMEDLGL